MIKQAKNRVMAGPKGHKKRLEQSHKEIETHAHFIGQQHMLTRQEEGGLPSPIWDLKTHFPPLKFLWNSVVKRPREGCLKGFKRWHKV